MSSDLPFIIDTGYATFSIKTLPKFAQKQLNLMYLPAPPDTAVDFEIELKTRSLIRRFWGKQIDFYVDDSMPFRPVPYKEAYAFLEWSMNWCVTSLLNTDLAIHAAVLEKDGYAVIFPAYSGSGKSTLTAYLMLNGWRLLSDEMAIINLTTKQVYPAVRPVCLKNDSIALVDEWRDELAMTESVSDTIKGTVAHLKPTMQSVNGKNKCVPIAGFLYPKYRSDVEFELYDVSMTQSMARLVENSFNFTMLGGNAFSQLASIVDQTWHVEAHYNDLAILKDYLEYQLEQA